MGTKALRNRQKNAVPTEFTLAVECCRWTNEPGRANAIAEAAAIADWQAFLATVERHRVAGLAWNALHSLGIPIPEATQSKLSTRANAIAAHGLQAAVQSAALSAALDHAAISHLFVKGLPVGALAYSAPFIKHSWDIDLLIDERRVEEAAALLDHLGFEVVFPDIGPDWSRLARWHQVQKDSAWHHRQTGRIVELHSRLADNPLLIPTVGISSPQQRVSVADGISLPTLAWPELFAHLCVHGASSAWFRLKWIGDLAALLVRSGSDLEELYQGTLHLGAGRSAAQALLLAHRLFDIPIDGRLLGLLNSSAANRWLASAALGQLLSPEPGGRIFGTGMIHLSQFLLLAGFRFKAIEARRQVAAARSNLFD